MIVTKSSSWASTISQSDACCIIQVKTRRFVKAKTPGRWYLPQRYILVRCEEGHGTSKDQGRQRKVGTESRTFVTSGIDITPGSGSQSYPPGSGEGPAAALSRLGKIQKERATRNPRINTH